MEQKPRIEKIAKWATIGWVLALLFWMVMNLIGPHPLVFYVPGAEESISFKLYNLLAPFVNNVISPIFLLIGFPVATISWTCVSIMDFMKHSIRKKVLVLAVFHLLIILFFALLFFDLL